MKVSEPIIEESLSWIKSPGLPYVPQITTDTENSEDDNPYDKLDDLHKLATQLRAKYLPYILIAKAIKQEFGRKYHEDSLRHLFDKTGPCREALEWYRKKLNAEAKTDLEEANNELRKKAIDAIVLLGDGLVNNNLSDNQIKIAQDLLDRTGFPRVAKQDYTGQVESNSINNLADGIKQILEKKT